MAEEFLVGERFGAQLSFQERTELVRAALFPLGRGAIGK